MKHSYSGETIHFELKYKNRKSIGVYVDGYGNLEVHAPKGTQEESVVEFLEWHWDKIIQKSKEVKGRLNGPQIKSYQHGEPFLYLGKSFPIEVHHSPEITQDYVTFNNEILNIQVKVIEDERIKQALKRFY